MFELKHNGCVTGSGDKPILSAFLACSVKCAHKTTLTTSLSWVQNVQPLCDYQYYLGCENDALSTRPVDVLEMSRKVCINLVICMRNSHTTCLNCVSGTA